MSDSTQESFPGWRSGQGRSVANIHLNATQLGKFLNRVVHEDHENRYLWFDNKKIGRMTVVSDVRDPLDYVDVYIESDVDRTTAFIEIINEIISKIPQDIPCQLEDEIDMTRAYRLRQVHFPPAGQY